MSSHDLIINFKPDNWILEGDDIEIGSQRKGGEGSSSELQEFAKRFGVRFSTVDFSETTYGRAKRSVGDDAVLSDGVEFLENYNGVISVLYLDNYDIGYHEEHFANLKSRIGDLYQQKGFDDSTVISQNLMSAQVHLSQGQAALPKMTKKAVVAVDDTFYRSDGRCWFGKGAFVVPFFLIAGFKLIESHKRGVLLARGIETVD